MVSPLLVNQQGFYVDFGEHEASMIGLSIACIVRT